MNTCPDCRHHHDEHVYSDRLARGACLHTEVRSTSDGIEQYAFCICRWPDREPWRAQHGLRGDDWEWDD